MLVQEVEMDDDKGCAEDVIDSTVMRRPGYAALGLFGSFGTPVSLSDTFAVQSSLRPFTGRSRTPLFWAFQPPVVHNPFFI
ncbi:hypothetical protein CGMCC3_g9935 [Colletotrichum fructicola]|nr:uncharacterized protein CGMCC3_g9935 [Colletotrichum fructicola]KAE9574019.1 hypothetical protein CGMCC3_g9935 [Colletotrichum fructicola]